MKEAAQAAKEERSSEKIARENDEKVVEKSSEPSQDGHVETHDATVRLSARPFVRVEDALGVFVLWRDIFWATMTPRSFRYKLRLCHARRPRS